MSKTPNPIERRSEWMKSNMDLIEVRMIEVDNVYLLHHDRVITLFSRRYNRGR